MCDYAGGLALHFNYRSTRDEAIKAIKTKYRSKMCNQEATLWMIWMWTSNINRHKYYQLLWAYYSTIWSDWFGILLKRGTWVVCKWVKWYQRFPKVMWLEHQHISMLLSCRFLFPYLFSTSLCLINQNITKAIKGDL